MDKKDIESREDLLFLLRAFYDKAVYDDVIGHFFTKVIPLDMAEHIPVIADFWETVLLNGSSYKKNAMIPHIHIHQLSPMEERHFKRWLELFCGTVDTYFAGETAERAKQRAKSIAAVMQLKVSNSNPLNVVNR